MSLNKVILIGNLTRNPEPRKTGGGTSVCGFDIAVNRKFKGANGEAKDEVTFVSCEAWGKTADNVCQYLSKGSQVLIEGRLKLDQWEKDGVKKQRLSVVCETVQFLNGKKSAEKEAAGENFESQSQPSSSAEKPYDLPF